MESKRDFKGVWIEKELWFNKELTWMEKLFLTEIHSLDNDEHCYASNAHFAEFFNLSNSRASQIISSLTSKKCITSEIIKKGKVIEKRIIKLTPKGIKFIKGGYLENAKGNNKYINNISKEIYDSKESTNSSYKINEDILKNVDILIGNKKIFGTTLPCAAKPTPTKEYLKIQKYIQQMIDGEFIIKNDFNKTFLNKQDLSRFQKPLKIKKLFVYLKTAAEKFYEHHYKLKQKRSNYKYNRTFSHFLFNSEAGISSFISFLNSKCTGEEKQTEEKYIQHIPIKLKNIFSGFYNNNKQWNYNLFWKKSYTLYKWFIDNQDKLEYDNKAEHFPSHIIGFLDVYFKWIETWDNFSLGNYGMDNKSWPYFEKYLSDEHRWDISLPNIKRIKKTEKLPDYDINEPSIYELLEKAE